MGALAEDLNRYFVLVQRISFLQKLKIILLTQGIWAICVYRFGAYLQEKGNGILWTKPLRLFATVLQKIIEILTGISISFSVKIGKGLYIGHFGGIFIHKGVRMGDYCNISQGVSIGLGGRGEQMGVPTIGDRVYIGPHAVVLGKITIGNDVAIGANAVVTKSVPDMAVVGGVPAKVLNFQGSRDFVVFRKRAG